MLLPVNWTGRTRLFSWRVFLRSAEKAWLWLP